MKILAKVMLLEQNFFTLTFYIYKTSAFTHLLIPNGLRRDLPHQPNNRHVPLVEPAKFSKSVYLHIVFGENDKMNPKVLV